MPGLYNITSNTNVAVTNTTGLYIGNGSSAILNSAQQLLSLLSNNGTVTFTLTSGNTQVEAFATGGTYGNSNVATYLAANNTVVITTQGNITAPYFFGNGYYLTGLTGSSYSNANVAEFLPVYTGNVNAAYYFGNGSGLSGIKGANVTGTVPLATTATYVTGLTSANVTTALGYVPLNSNAASNYGNANVAAYLPTYTGNLVSLTGNVITTANVQGAYILGNGSQLTGVVTNYSNANVTSYLPTYTGNLVSLTGNVITSANVTGAYFIGNGSQLTGITTNYSNTNVAAFLPTYTGNLQAGNISTTGALGNISGANYVNANYFTGNGALLTGITTNYSNVNVAAYLPTYTGNLVSLTGNVTTTANVTAAYHIGNGSTLTNLTGANVTGYVPNASTANTAGLATYVTANAQANITSVGTLTSLTVTGNVTPGGISTAGNVTANYFLGNGSQLTGLPATYGNANVASYLASNSNITIATTGNITAGNISTLGTLGNISGANYVNALYFTGNGALLTGIATNYSNVNVAAYLPTYTGNLVSLTGNVITSANVTAAYHIGNGSALTNITGANVTGTVANAAYATQAGQANNANTATTATYVTGLTSANVTTALGYVPLNSNSSAVSAGLATYVTANAQANITSVGTLTSLTVTGNVTPGGISTAGNVTALYFIGNGSQLTGVTSYSNANVASYLASNSNVTILTTGNISAPNFIATGTTGNITGANFVTANFFVGNGSLLTGIATSTYGNANVASYLASNSAITITTTGNVTTNANVQAAYFKGNGSLLTGIATGPSSYLANASSTLTLAANGYVTFANGAVISSGANPGVSNSEGSIGIGPSSTGGANAYVALASANGENFTTLNNNIYGIGFNSISGPFTFVYFDSSGVIHGAKLEGPLVNGSSNLTLEANGSVTFTNGAAIAIDSNPGLPNSNGSIAMGASPTGGANAFVALGSANNENFTVLNNSIYGIGFNQISGPFTFVYFDSSGTLNSAKLNGALIDPGTGHQFVISNSTGNIETNANMVSTANITAVNFIGNGSQLTGIATSSGGFNPFLLAGM